MQNIRTIYWVQVGVFAALRPDSCLELHSYDARKVWYVTQRQFRRDEAQTTRLPVRAQVALGAQISILKYIYPRVRPMPKVVEGRPFYLAHEVAKAAGISKQTLLRWIAENRVKDAAKRDRNGWRLFTEPEVEAILRFAQDGA